MTRAFEIKDLEYDVEVVYKKDEDHITLYKEPYLNTTYELSKDDLMKIVLVAVEAGLIDRKELVIELQT